MRLKNDNFSVRWTGKIYFNETTAYSLYIHGDDGAKVWIDDELIYDQWHPAHPLQVIKFYQKGLHDIRIEYRDLLMFLAELPASGGRPSPPPICIIVPNGHMQRTSPRAIIRSMSGRRTCWATSVLLQPST